MPIWANTCEYPSKFRISNVFKGHCCTLHILLLLKTETCLLITASAASISLSAGTPESTTRRRVEKLAPSHNVVTATQQLKPGKVPVILPIELLLSMISNRKGVKLPEAIQRLHPPCLNPGYGYLWIRKTLIHPQ